MADQPIRSFQVTPVPRAGFFGWLFGRVPRAAAFVELRNLLATTPCAQVRASDVTAALARVKLDCRQAVPELSGIFEHAVLLAALDHSLTEADRHGLQNLQRAFELTDAEAAAAIESAVGLIYERTMREALLDGIFTEAESARLAATATTLGMAPAQRQRLFDAVAAVAVQATFSSAAADRRLTEAEDAQIAALAKALGANMLQDADTQATVARYRLLAAVDAGSLPIVPVSILLQRGELCHFSGAAGMHEIRTVTRRVNYSGPTASIRIMKGLHWRIGSIAFQKVTTDVMTQLDTGTLYITSKRLFFDGSQRNRSLALGKITKFTVFKDGIQIEKDTGKDPYFVGAGDWELAGACLDAALGKLHK